MKEKLHCKVFFGNFRHVRKEHNPYEIYNVSWNQSTMPKIFFMLSHCLYRVLLKKNDYKWLPIASNFKVIWQKQWYIKVSVEENLRTQ